MKKIIALTFLVLFSSSVTTATCYSNLKNSPIGMWTGTLGQSRIAIEIEQNKSGNLEATYYNLDGRVRPFKGVVNNVETDGEKLYTILFKNIGVRLEGTLGSLEDTFELNFVRGKQRIPLKLKRVASVPEVEKRKGFVLPKGMNVTAPMELADWAFMEGEWHGKHTKKIGGGREGEFLLIWKGEWILDGNAMKNTSQTWMFKPNGEKGPMTQDGMDIRTFNSQTKVFDHTYINARSGKINKMTWKRVGDEIHSEPSEWQDFEGFNMNIIKFKNISKDHFTWAVDRSFDKGETWKKDYVVIENVKINK